MKKSIDLLILNNCPAFYKINLYNEIAKHKEIFVVFIGYYDQVVIEENFKHQIKFPYVMLNEKQLSARSLFTSMIRLLRVVKTFHFKKIIYGGYTYPEFIITSFLTARSKNILQTESAGETKLQGIRYFVKRILLKRYTKALASGSMQKLMLRKMGFEKETIITNGVGMLNRENGSTKERFDRNSAEQLKFLYVGRLIELKNVRTLVDVFNENGLSLTIAGKGELHEELEAKARPNITFTGFVDNRELATVYKNHHVLVLPSLSEAWGLVVEEAIYRGCVLLLSDRVGCLQELLLEPNIGAAFNPMDINSFHSAVNDIKKNYIKYKKNVDQYDLEQKDIKQVLAYTKEIYRD